MEIFALLSDRENEVILKIREVLSGWMIYPLNNLEQLEELLDDIPVNLIIIDTIAYPIPHLKKLLNKLDDRKVILIISEKSDRYAFYHMPKSIYDSVQENSIASDLPRIVQRALENQQMQDELGFIKQSYDKTLHDQKHAVYNSQADIVNLSRSSSEGKRSHNSVIVKFARMLASGFEIEKLFDHFIESVLEIAHVSRMSVLIREEDGFRIKRHYGLDPYIAENFFLERGSSLAGALRKSGRILHKPVNFDNYSSARIKKEMELLNCVVSFPMIHNGKLTGIFNIDNKITDEPFYASELEIIYVLCNYLATSVRDIELYNQMWYQQEFTKNVLSSMNSGMIAINEDKKITVFNQHASEILNLHSGKMHGSGLGELPEALAGILSETLDGKTTYKRLEITIESSGSPIGVNSFRLLDEKQIAIGAGIVFADLTETKSLEREVRRAEKLEAVNDLMAKIAHEIRNPMTSIQTYIQLLHSRNEDKELHDFFTSTVNLSIEKLDSLIDKLVIFSSTQDYHFVRDDINDVLNAAIDMISRNIPGTHQINQRINSQPCYVHVDRKILIKAFYYIALSIVESTPDGASISVSTIMEEKENESFVKACIKYDGGDSIEGANNLERPLIDIVNLGVELNIPISQKIIEGHGGSLYMQTNGEINAYIIQLPVIHSLQDSVSSKEVC